MENEWIGAITSCWSRMLQLMWTCPEAQTFWMMKMDCWGAWAKDREITDKQRVEALRDIVRFKQRQTDGMGSDNNSDAWDQLYKIVNDMWVLG